VDAANAWLASVGLAAVTELPLDAATLFSYAPMDGIRIAAAGLTRPAWASSMSMSCNTYDLEPDVRGRDGCDRHPDPGGRQHLRQRAVVRDPAWHRARVARARQRHFQNDPAGFDAPRTFYQFRQAHPR
jgi:hypothetical protein